MYLNCHTYYSLRFGTFSELDLLDLAREKSVQELVLTDINNTSSCLNFVRKAPEFGVRPMVGIDFRNQVDQLYVGIAKNNQGYKHLNDFLSLHLHQKKEFPDVAPGLKDTYFVYPFERVLLMELTDFKEHEYIGISVNDLRKLPFSGYLQYKDKLLVMQTVTFRNKRDFNAHRLLRAIDNNTLLSKLPPSQIAAIDQRMLSASELSLAFGEYDFILKNTQRLLKECHIDFDFSPKAKSQNQSIYFKSKQEDCDRLRELCLEGLSYRYPEATSVVLERVEKELDLIYKMDFVSYFLITWDIVSYAKSKGYFHV